MAAVASEGVQGAHHRLAPRLRAAVLGPRGGGTTRRRASDAFRLGFAVVVVAVSIPVMRANSAVELSIVRVLTPPPAAISWLVTSVFWLGSAGVVVLLVVLGLLVPRLTAVRWTAVAARADLGGVRPARRAPRAGGRAAADQRAGRAAHRVSGHPARGHDRGGGDRAALSEPPGAPAGVVPGRPGGAGRGLRRGGASGQRRLQRRAGLGRRRGPAPGRGLTAGPAVGGGGDRVDRRPERRGRCHHPGPRQVWGVEQFTGRDPAGERSSCRSTAGTHPTPGCWPSCGGSACTGTPGPP